ncbi:hypothetical protein [Veillonella sp. VA142]|uniref:hypothetical protein n=1 Tax=Veillonella sp. VA142 TaxID=741834 RepID=UPI000F8E38C0|nr:hypothetical protein [Veillonella sp. VA142]
MDCDKEQKCKKDQLTIEENVRISFACMVDNQKNLIEAMKILNKCEVMTCSKELKNEYKNLIKKIENTYLREAKYVMSLKGL